MRVTTRTYPYPVLRRGNDDFVGSKFTCNLKLGKLSDKMFHFKFSFSLENSYLQELIDQDVAFFGIHIECQRTRLRKTFKTCDNTLEISLEKKDCREKIEICTFIIAKTTIEEYYSEKFNEDYDGATFRVEKGSRLSEGNRFDLKVIEEDEYELSNPLFIIQRNNKPNPPSIEINTENDTIIVYLSPGNFDDFKQKKNVYRDFISSSIGLPVVTYLIERLREEDEFDKRWSKILGGKIAESGLEDVDSLVAANIILDDSLTKGFNFMKFKLDQNEEGDE